MRRGCNNSNNKSIKSQTKNTAILNRFPPSNISQRPPGPALSSKQRSSFLFFFVSGHFPEFSTAVFGQTERFAASELHDLHADGTEATIVPEFESQSKSKCSCCCPSLPDDWGKVRLRNFHKQHEALLEEVFASSIGWLHVARLLPVPVPVPVCRYFLGPLATSACRLSVCPNCVCALGQRCQRARHQVCLQSVPVASVDGSAWLSMYVHLNCQLVCVRVCITVCVSLCVCVCV